MKHKETVDDRAVKDASKIQRKAEKVDLIEGEDPEKYKWLKRMIKRVLGKFKNRQKKGAREDREKSIKAINAAVRQPRNGNA